LVRPIGREVVEGLYGLEPLTGRRRTECSDRHNVRSLRPFEEFRHLGAFGELHVRLLPVGPASGVASLALDLAVRDARADAFDLRAEQLLDRALDFRLVRARRDLKHDRPSILPEDRRLLGDQRATNDISQLHKRPLRFWILDWGFWISNANPQSD